MPNYTCIKKPIISEKSSLLQDQGVYTFEVDIKSNKSQIKSNVENLLKMLQNKKNLKRKKSKKKKNLKRKKSKY